MHALIINGSPRVKQYSNTDKILAKFTEGFCEAGNTFEQYEVSDRKQWDKIREAFGRCDNVLIAIPLYVECIPGLLLEFLETVQPKDGNTKLAFILQGGFAEGAQLRCGEAYLKILTERLGCRYMGTLVKGDNFSIRFVDEEQGAKVTGPYMEMGRIFGRDGNFMSDECRKFTGPEIFPAPMRFLLGFVFSTFAKKAFQKIGASIGCSKPLDDRPYDAA